MKIAFTSAFVRQIRKLPVDLQEEIYEKVGLFKSLKSHRQLKVHKLHGTFSSCYGFSVNYKTRIVFEYLSKEEVIFHAVGDHDIYK